MPNSVVTMTAGGERGCSREHEFRRAREPVWRRHHLRRYSLNKAVRFSNSTKSTAYKWGLYSSMLVALIGLFVTFIVNVLVHAKFDYMNQQMRSNQACAYFSLLFISMSYALTGLCCWFEPCAAGSGIAEVGLLEWNKPPQIC